MHFVLSFKVLYTIVKYNDYTQYTNFIKALIDTVQYLITITD